MRAIVILWFVLLVMICSCRSTKHTVIPYNGFVPKAEENVLVHMLNSSYDYDSELSGQVLDQLNTCDGKLLSFENTRDKLFSHLVVFNRVLIPDTATLARINRTIDADYLLTGGYLDTSKNGGLGIDFFNSQDQYNYDNGWSELHFVLIDLHTYKTALKLIVKTTSGSMDLPDRDDDGYVTTIHSSKRVKVKKALKILSKTFHCN